MSENAQKENEMKKKFVHYLQKVWYTKHIKTQHYSEVVA